VLHVENFDDVVTQVKSPFLGKPIEIITLGRIRGKLGVSADALDERFLGIRHTNSGLDYLVMFATVRGELQEIDRLFYSSDYRYRGAFWWASSGPCAFNKSGLIMRKTQFRKRLVSVGLNPQLVDLVYQRPLEKWE
jgi:hypothetical protein